MKSRNQRVTLFAVLAATTLLLMLIALAAVSLGSLEDDPVQPRIAAYNLSHVAQTYQGPANPSDADALIPAASIHALDVSPDGRYLAVGYAAAPEARIFDVQTGELIHTLVTLSPDDGYGSVIAVAFSPDGKFIATGNSNEWAHIWDAATGEMVDELAIHGGGQSVAFSPDGQLLVVASYFGATNVYEAATGELLYEWTADSPSTRLVSAAFSPAGETIFIGSENGMVWLWDYATNTLRHEYQDNLLMGEGQFTADGQKVILPTATGLKIWDVQIGNIEKLIPVQAGVSTLELSADSRLALTNRWQDHVVLWDATTWQVIATFNGLEGQVDAIGISPDGQSVYVALNDGSVRRWSI